MSAIIDIQNLSVGFTSRTGATLTVLHDATLQVARGECVGIVGESGSGKSTLALAAMGYLKSGLRVLNGHARFDGQDMFAADQPTLERIRGGQLGLVPQNSGQSLTPTLRIKAQLLEALRLHCPDSAAGHEAKVIELLGQVRLPDPAAIAERYPHELSGGQQQRVAIAMALAGEPEALLLDEPTTGLDVTTQVHLLQLLRRIASERNMAMVYVSHDLGVISHVAGRVVVMYAGEICLEGPAASVLTAPSHPYAQGLLSAVPRLNDRALPTALEGHPPAPEPTRSACAFAPRCALADAHCRAANPPLAALSSTEQSRCIHTDQIGRLRSTRAERPLPQSRSEITHAVLELEQLSISYHQRGLFDRLLGKQPPTPTVADIALSVQRGETIGLVGESGSGKSTILKAVEGLLAPSAGEILLDGTPLATSAGTRSPNDLRRVQMVFQNPDASLNPRHTICEILGQPLRLYDGLTGDAARERAGDLLERVRLSRQYLDRMPGQLSGGEKQRVAIARAFAAKPEIVLCDEITSALDVSVQAAVLDLLNDFKRSDGTTYLFVSHDLAVVRALSDRVAVLYQGRICEIGPTQAVYGLVSHPYTRALLDAVLDPDPGATPKLHVEDITELSPPARGCPFQRRCPRHLGAICDTEAPPAQDHKGHIIHCHIPRNEL